MSPKSEAERHAAAAALRAAGEKFDEILHLSEADVEEMVADFDRLRKKRPESDES